MRTRPLFKSPEGERKVMALYDAMLSGCQIPCETFTVPTRYGATFIIASGDTAAPVLILVHGTDSNSAYWLREIAHYRRYYRVYAIDALGEPGRSASVRPDWKSPAYYEWMQDIWDTLNIQKASMLGLSQGGWIIIKYAISNPQAVEKLVLLSPAGVVPLRWSFRMRILSFLPFKQQGKDAIVKQLFGSQPVPEDIYKFSIAVLENFQSRKKPMPVFSDNEIQRLTMPVLLLGGSQDAIFDAEKTATRLLQCLPDLHHCILENAGHSLYGITEHILPFLLPNTVQMVL